MAELFTLPARATDSNNVVASGAKLYLYVTGTTTPQAAYSNSGLTTPHSNPVIADSGGKFAGIYLDPAKVYRAVLKTSNDATTIFDLDPIGSGSSAADIGFLQAGTGAALRTVQDKLRDTVSVKDFGAAVDGATNDTTAFQNAINTGKDVLLAPGTMVIGLVTMANNDQRIIGSRACTVKHKNSTTGNLFTITGASCALIGFNIDGNSSNQAYSYNAREVLVSGAKAELRGLRITDAQSQGIGLIKGALACIVSDNEIERVGDFGIFIDGAAGSGSDPAYGVCKNNTVVDFGLQGGGGGVTTSVGIGLRSTVGGWRVTNNLVRNTASRTNNQLGIECWTNSNNVVVDGNVIDMSAASSGEFGLSITGYGSIVSNNLVLGTSSYGIEVIDRAVTITGNILRSPTGVGIGVNLNSGHTDPGDVVTISGNTIENTAKVTGTHGAIVVSGDPGVTPIAITISGNTTHGLSHGIVVGELVTGYTITGNTCWNTGSAQTGIIPLGTDGNTAGNTIIRVDAAGTGNGGGIVVGGSGNLVSGNRISGNSRIDNGILINSGATNTLIAGNFITGCANAVFSSATAASVVVRDNTSTTGLALQTANRATGNINTSNDSVASQLLPLNLGSFTVATLPAVNVLVATTAFVTDANATTFNSIVAGGGSNKVPVTYDGTNWRIG